MFSLAGPTLAGEMILTGGQKGLWLLRLEEGMTFDVLAKPAGGKWRWVARELSGVPAAAGAESRLHVLLRGGGHLIFGLNEGDRIPGDSLDASPPVAACGAADFAGQGGPTILAVVRQSAGRAPTTHAESQPATAGSRPTELVKLAAYQNADGEWKPLGEWDQVTLSAEGAVFAAATAKALYVLVSGGGANRLYAWQDGQSREIPLTGPVASRRALAMLAFRDRLVVVLAVPSEDASRIHVHVASVHDPDKGFPEPYQPVARDGVPASWPADEPPLAARLADQITMLWREGNDLKFATCDTSGRMNPAETFDLFEHAPVHGKGQEILDYFLWGALVLMAVPLFLGRPQGPPKPFVLPAHLQPGGLLKRFLAALIDLAPPTVAGSLVFLPALPLQQRSREETLEMLSQLRDSETAAYAAILSLVLYVGYGIVMERRFGATLGKMLLRLQVVGDDGRRVGWREAILRNMWKTAELLFWLPLPTPMPVLLLAPLLSRMRQRVGDMLARTAVVEVSVKPPPPSSPTDQEGEQPPVDRDETNKPGGC